MRNVFQKFVDDHFSAQRFQCLWTFILVQNDLRRPFSMTVVFWWENCFLMKHTFSAVLYQVVAVFMRFSCVVGNGPVLVVSRTSTCILIAVYATCPWIQWNTLIVFVLTILPMFGVWESCFQCCFCLPQNCVASSLYVLIVRDYQICSLNQGSGTIILVRSKWLESDDHFSAQMFPGAFGTRRSF